MKKTVLISAPCYYGIDTDIRDAFENLGFNTLLINQYPLPLFQRIPNKIANKLTSIKPLINPFLKSFVIRENDALLSTINKERPDLIFIIKGDYIFPSNLEQIKKEYSCPIMGYCWDDPFYEPNSNQDDFRKYNLRNGIHLYDYLFVFDTFYIDAMIRQGAKNVQYLPLATNPNRYKEIVTTSQEKNHYDYDVCFIGMPSANRVEAFESLKDYKLGVFGDYWVEYFVRRRKKVPSYYRGKASGDTVNKIYFSSKIALNINQDQSREGLNTRTFDILACGAFEIVDYKKNIENHFKIDEEIVTYKSLDELNAKVKYYLKNSSLRESIAMNGKKRVLSEHTWVHRMKHAISTL